MWNDLSLRQFRNVLHFEFHLECFMPNCDKHRGHDLLTGIMFPPHQLQQEWTILTTGAWYTTRELNPELPEWKVSKSPTRQHWIPWLFSRLIIFYKFIYSYNPPILYNWLSMIQYNTVPPIPHRPCQEEQSTPHSHAKVPHNLWCRKQRDLLGFESYWKYGISCRIVQISEYCAHLQVKWHY